MGPRTAPRLAVAVVIAAAVFSWPTRPAGAAQSLSAGSVVALSDPHVALAAVPDGRLNGYGFAVTVEGVSFLDRLTDPGNGQVITPAPGAQLLALRLHLVGFNAQGENWLDSTVLDDGPDPALTVVTPAGRIPLPYNLGLVADSDYAWAVAMAPGVAASLEVARDGYTQALDLRTGRPVGPHPVALYRDPTNPFLHVDVAAQQTLTATISAGGSVLVAIGITGAVLSYFPPAGAAVAPQPPSDQGWLILKLDASVPDGSQIRITRSLPGSAVRLIGPGGQSQPSVNSPNPLGGGLFSGYYAFQVPGDVTTAHIQVTPGANVAATTGPGSRPDAAVSFNGQADFNFTITAPRSAPTQNPTSPGPPSTTPRHKTTSPALPVVAGLIAAVAVLAVAVLVLRRRRRELRPTPVRHTQAQLLAPLQSPALRGTRPNELPGPPPALGPGHSPGDPSQPPPGQPASGPKLVVMVLGPLKVEGLRRPLRRRPVTRMLVYLALHIDRPVSGDELRYALATSDETEPGEKTLWSYASYLRAALPDGLLPQATQGGYRYMPGVEVDWALFDALVVQARERPGDAGRLLRVALGMVRGEPLAHEAWAGVDDQVRHMVAVIERAAHQAATVFLAGGDAREAEWAIGQGLLAAPASPGLWEDRLIAASAGSGYGLERAWGDAQRALGGDAVLLEGSWRRLHDELV